MLLTGLSCPYACVVPVKLIIIFKTARHFFTNKSQNQKLRSYQTLYTWTHIICCHIKRKKTTV